MTADRSVKSHTAKNRVLILLFFLWTASCQPPPADPFEGLPVESVEVDPARLPGQPAADSGWAAASHILVRWRGAEGWYKRIKLDRSGARRRAERLLELARGRGQDFEALARKFSDDSATAAKGGHLGVFARGELHPALERAVFSVQPGQVADLVESPAGFHVLMRTDDRYAQAAEIVVAHDQALRYRPRQPRSRQQAKELAAELHRRLLAGEDFFELARNYSDLSSAERGGVVAVFSAGEQHPDFEKIVWGLSPGQVSEVIETPTGFHIVKRLVIERIPLRQLFIEYQALVMPGEKRKKPTPEEAGELAQRIVNEARGGKDFAYLISAYSHTTSPQVRWYSRGELPYLQEKAAFSLRPGELAGPFDTANGWLILQRANF